MIEWLDIGFGSSHLGAGGWSGTAPRKSKPGKAVSPGRLGSCTVAKRAAILGGLGVLGGEVPFFVLLIDSQIIEARLTPLAVPSRWGRRAPFGVLPASRPRVTFPMARGHVYAPPFLRPSIHVSGRERSPARNCENIESASGRSSCNVVARIIAPRALDYFADTPLDQIGQAWPRLDHCHEIRRDQIFLVTNSAYRCTTTFGNATIPRGKRYMFGPCRGY